LARINGTGRKKLKQIILICAIAIALAFPSGAKDGDVGNITAVIDGR
jgi:hypothetical protein